METAKSTLKKIRAINRMSAGQRIKSYLRHPLSLTLALLVCLAALITVCMLVFIVVYILAKGIPYLTPSLFELEYTTENVSLFPAIVTTIEMTLLSLLIAAPLGILTAVYLVEYAKRGNKLVGLVRLTSETLSGIPSIVYGLFGMLFFVTAVHLSLIHI